MIGPIHKELVEDSQISKTIYHCYTIILPCENLVFNICSYSKLMIVFNVYNYNCVKRVLCPISNELLWDLWGNENKFRHITYYNVQFYKELLHHDTLKVVHKNLVLNDKSNPAFTNRQFCTAYCNVFGYVLMFISWKAVRNATGDLGRKRLSVHVKCVLLVVYKPTKNCI